MRHFAVVAAAVLATATVAHADPLSVEATQTAPASEPNLYVSTGVMAGGMGDFLTGAVTVEAGFQMPGTKIWLHAMVADGHSTELLASGTGSFTQGRVGVETKRCVLEGIVCSLFGVDAGYQDLGFTGQDISFGEGDGQMVSANGSGVVVVPRYVLDIGNTWVRVRPGIEIPLSAAGAGVELTAALAVKF